MATSTTARTLVIAGKPQAFSATAEEDLLAVLRKKAGLKSLLRGCKNERCGACRVLVDGKLTRTCGTRLESLAEGATVTAYEEIAKDPSAMHAIAVFEGSRPSRCHLCVPALGLAAVHLVRIGKRGDRVAVDHVLEGAACMCTGRASLREALMK
jgi:aerobic-type carbon monoxide dehydrogenase small subunit (CoxS/CutS family)